MAFRGHVDRVAQRTTAGLSQRRNVPHPVHPGQTARSRSPSFDPSSLPLGVSDDSSSHSNARPSERLVGAGSRHPAQPRPAASNTSTRGGPGRTVKANEYGFNTDELENHGYTIWCHRCTTCFKRHKDCLAHFRQHCESTEAYQCRVCGITFRRPWKHKNHCESLRDHPSDSQAEIVRAEPRRVIACRLCRQLSSHIEFPQHWVNHFANGLPIFDADLNASVAVSSLLEQPHISNIWWGTAKTVFEDNYGQGHWPPLHWDAEAITDDIFDALEYGDNDDEIRNAIDVLLSHLGPVWSGPDEGRFLTPGHDVSHTGAWTYGIDEA